MLGLIAIGILIIAIIGTYWKHYRLKRKYKQNLFLLARYVQKEEEIEPQEEDNNDFEGTED